MNQEQLKTESFYDTYRSQILRLVKNCVKDNFTTTEAAELLEMENEDFDGTNWDDLVEMVSGTFESYLKHFNQFENYIIDFYITEKINLI